MNAGIPVRPLMSGRFLLGGVPLRRLGQAPQGCIVPGGYGPQGRAVVACSVGNGLYNVLDAASGAAVMSSIPSDCLKEFGNFTIAAPGDPRCGAVGSASLDPCGISADAIYKPLLACPGPSGYSIIDPATNTIIMSNVSQACLVNFKSLTISTPADPRCSSAQPAPPSIVSDPGARQVTFPLAGMMFPWTENAPLTKVGKPSGVYNVTPAPRLSPPPPLPPSAGYAPPPLPQPPPDYAPGQPIPVQDWFGICRQMPGA